MNQRLTDQQINAACSDLVARHRMVGVREVMQLLLERHGSKGSTQRVARALRRALEDHAAPPSPIAEPAAEIESLRAQLRAAEKRAEEAWELERHHQNYWARRYDEKLEELEKRSMARPPGKTTITSEQYLRLYQRAAELVRRLEQYEHVEDMQPLKPR